MDDFLNYIPHREPFLFVDRVIQQTKDTVNTEKKVKADEPQFRGHFPGRPVMPGVLLCESVLQSGAILLGKLTGNPQGKTPLVTRMNNVKFKHKVVPGDLLEIDVKLKEEVGAAAYLTGRVRVDSKTVLTMDFSVMLVEETA